MDQSLHVSLNSDGNNFDILGNIFMTSLLAFVSSNPTILVIATGVIGAAAAWMHGRVTGAKAERRNQIAAGIKARTEGEQNDEAEAGRARDANREGLAIRPKQ
ncbi:hypothetical protein ACWGS9_28320 [Bradyrhizobium sp. Arg314]